VTLFRAIDATLNAPWASGPAALLDPKSVNRRKRRLGRNGGSVEANFKAIDPAEELRRSSMECLILERMLSPTSPWESANPRDLLRWRSSLGRRPGIKTALEQFQPARPKR